jgi:hypothetical protein
MIFLSASHPILLMYGLGFSFGIAEVRPQHVAVHLG